MAKDISKYAILESELADSKQLMQTAVDKILQEEVSKYPIFVVHQQQIGIGIPIAEGGQGKGNWSIYVSTLEEFISKKLIQKIKVDSFKTIYKNPKTHLCLFVLSEMGADFIFMPRENPNK